MVDVRAEQGTATVEVEELIRRCQFGDKLALELLVRRYQNYIFRLCYLVMRREQDAEDMTQETLLRVCRALPRYELREGVSFEAWLYRIAVNCCRSRMRRKWYQMQPSSDSALEPVAHPDLQPDRCLEHSQRRNEILTAIDSLGDKHRLVVILRYYAGLSNEEIAQTLALPSGTVRSRLHTARQRLKELLEAAQARHDRFSDSRRLAR